MVRIITIEQKGETGILIFDRDDNGKRVTKFIDDFKPYFYFEDFLTGNYTSIYGEKCRKIFTKSSRDVIYERTKYNKVYEADIHYTDRFLIDRIKTPIPKRNLRKCLIDIENKDSLDVINTPEPITLIGCFDNYLNKYLQFCYVEKQVLANFKDNLKSQYFFNSEGEMLSFFIKFITENDPDLLIGFNINFDLSYIINRSKKLNIHINSISPLNYTKIDKFGVKVYGRVVLDMKKLLKRHFIKKELFSYSLNNIALHLLGRGKTEINKSPGELWRENLQLLLEYNLNDIRLIKEIDDRYNVIEFYDTLRRYVGCGWERLTSFSYLHDIETYRKAKDFGFIIPKTELKEIKNADGAFVQEPQKGLYSYIINLDIKSAYPYAIFLANISPETFSKDGDVIISENLRFNSSPIGLIPSIIKDELKNREEAKNLMLEEFKINGETDKYKTLNIIQYALKILPNSFYGLFNTEFYVLKDRNITEAITLFVKKSILWSIDVVNKEGYEIIYSDTDGIYINSKSTNLEQALSIGNLLKDKINLSYKDFLTSLGIKSGSFEIKFEGVFDSYFIGSKKHYFGHLCWKEGTPTDEMIIKGYEIIRVDTAKVCKDLMDTLFKMILDKRTQQEITTYIQKFKKTVYSLTLKDIGIPKPYKKENKVKTAHFKAVEFSNKYLNSQIEEGERIMYIYGHIKGLPNTEAFAFKVNDVDKLKNKEIIINWQKMQEVLIDNKVKRLFEALKWEEEKITLLNYL